MTSISPVASAPSPFASLPHFDHPTYLMCPPEFYDVNYVINPWMAGNLHRPSRDAAFAQWKNLHRHLQGIADIRLLHPRTGSPDMVFVAHSALVQHGIAAVSSFAHPQRQTEEQHLRRWFQVEDRRFTHACKPCQLRAREAGRSAMVFDDFVERLHFAAIAVKSFDF